MSGSTLICWKSAESELFQLPCWVLAANCGWFHNMTTSQRRNGAFFAFNDLQPHVFPGAAPPLWTLQDSEFPSGGGSPWDMITKSKSFPSGPLTLPLQWLASISTRLLRALFGDQIFLIKYKLGLSSSPNITGDKPGTQSSSRSGLFDDIELLMGLGQVDLILAILILFIISISCSGSWFWF